MSSSAIELESITKTSEGNDRWTVVLSVQDKPLHRELRGTFHIAVHPKNNPPERLVEIAKTQFREMCQKALNEK
jgi:hypothetical protein